MYYFNKKTQAILDLYEDHLEIIDSIAIGFTGTAGERPAKITTDQVSADVLWFALGVNFNVADVLVWIQSRSPQYDLMINQNSQPQYTPITAVAGSSSQVMPVLPLIQPFFQEANAVMSFQFVNSATTPVGSIGIITLRGLKLLNPFGASYRYGLQAK